MKSGYTHLSIIIDGSSSMQTIKGSIIKGFNDLIEDQKKEVGELTVTLVQFSGVEKPWFGNKYDRLGMRDRVELEYKTINDFTQLNEVQLLNHDSYRPEGWTPLNDAVTRLIDETGKRLAAIPEAMRPEKVIVAILTDGEENKSVFATRETVKKLIEEQEQKYNWKFLYVGANQDSAFEGQSRGIGSTMNYSADLVGTTSALYSMSNAVKRSRSMDNAMYKSYDATMDMANDYENKLKEEKKDDDKKDDNK